MGKELILTSCLAPDPDALSMALTASDEDIAPDEVAVLARPRPTARSDKSGGKGKQRLEVASVQDKVFQRFFTFIVES